MYEYKLEQLSHNKLPKYQWKHVNSSTHAAYQGPILHQLLAFDFFDPVFIATFGLTFGFRVACSKIGPLMNGRRR